MANNKKSLPEKGVSSFRELVKNKNFVKLWISQVCSTVATRMITLTLIINVFQTTKSSTLVVLLIFAFAIPALIFGLPAGAYVDRHSRRKTLIYTNLVQAFSVLIFLFTGGNIFLTLLVVFAYASINQLYIPAEAAMIPYLVPDKNLLGANSLFMFTVYGSLIFGYGAAGPIMLLFGNNAPFILSFVLIFIAFVASIILPQDQYKIKKLRIEKIYTDIMREFKEAYIFIKSKKIVSQAILRLTFVQALIGALAVLIPAYSDRILHMDVRTVSVIFIMPVGLGTVLGAILISKIGKRINIYKLVKRVIILDGIIICLMGAAYPLGRFLKYNLSFLFLNTKSLLWLIGALVTLLGFLSVMIIVSAQTELQRQTPYEIRGRVFGIFGIIVTVIALLPMLFMGALADIFSVTTVFIIGGLLMILYGILTQVREV